MELTDVYDYCLSKEGSSDHQPFGDDTVVFKIGPENKRKCFALLSCEKNYILLKCDPELAIELRERYEFIEPGFHMNKKHWNGVYCGSDIADSFLREMIDHSYNLVLSPRKTPSRH